MAEALDPTDYHSRIDCASIAPVACACDCDGPTSKEATR